MPEEKTIHDLPIAEQVTSSDVFETEIPSQLMQSGFASRKVSLSELEEHILGDEQYSTGLPNFPAGSRTIFSALEYARQSGGGGGASVVQKTMAEYTALPSADKMNGSIYKITDKALIYCLDEEYHAVKEITSADYALLTSAEKNNGTLYIITDEETTASDIPYSAGVSVADKLDNVPTFDTLTTSDNNKLLGVSVSGGDISVEAVGTISGTITPTSGWTLNSGILNKSGKVCEAYVEITGGTLSEGWNTLATIPSGFRPPNNMDFVGIDNRNVTACQAKITSSGNLQVFKTSSLANNIRLHVTYLIS